VGKIYRRERSLNEKEKKDWRMVEMRKQMRMRDCEWSGCERV
jgi:hypothetical protein